MIILYRFIMSCQHYTQYGELEYINSNIILLLFSNLIEAYFTQKLFRPTNSQKAIPCRKNVVVAS